MARMKLSSSSNSKYYSKTIKEEYKNIGGPKVDYSKYYMSAPKAPSYYNPKTMTDEQMLKNAQDRVHGIYNTYIKNSQMERDFNIGTIKSAIEQLNPLYQDRMGALRDNYAEKERDLMNNALSKGMGRSSYIGDVKSENSAKMSKGLNSIDMEHKQAQKNLGREMEKENLKFDQAKNKYTAQKSMDTKSLVAQMQKDRDKTLFDAQKYNDGLYENYTKLVLNQQKHNLDVQKYIDSLNAKKVTVTTTTRTSSSNTYKRDDKVDRDAINELWGKMDYAQKIAYVKKNTTDLKSAVPDLYYKFNKDIAEYVNNTFIDKIKNHFF